MPHASRCRDCGAMGQGTAQEGMALLRDLPEHMGTHSLWAIGP